MSEYPSYQWAGDPLDPVPQSKSYFGPAPGCCSAPSTLKCPNQSGSLAPHGSAQTLTGQSIINQPQVRYFTQGNSFQMNLLEESSQFNKNSCVYWETLRDVKGEGHCRAEHYDITPEGQEAPISSTETGIYDGENFNIWGNHVLKDSRSHSQEESYSQHGEDNLKTTHVKTLDILRNICMVIF